MDAVFETPKPHQGRWVNLHAATVSIPLLRKGVREYTVNYSRCDISSV